MCGDHGVFVTHPGKTEPDRDTHQTFRITTSVVMKNSFKKGERETEAFNKKQKAKADRDAGKPDTIVFGHSDDIVSIEGAISDETDSYNSKSVITASDGTRAYIEYDDGWRIAVEREGILFDRVQSGLGSEHEGHHADVRVCQTCKSVPIYSDVLIFMPGLEWIKVNSKKFKPHG
jgi:hypothetical protein